MPPLLVPARALPRTAWVAAGRRISADGAIVLAYHDVRPAAGGYHVTPVQLAAHIELVRSSGLQIVPLDVLVDRLLRTEAVDGLAAITFDDALIGVAELAVPVLAHLRAPATVFAVAHRLGRPPDWATGERRTLTAAELSALAQEPGLTIGSHASTHRSLVALDEGDLAGELTESRTVLRAIAGGPVDLLAYPFGHHDVQVRRAVATAGYRAAFTFLNGRIGPSDDPLRLPRLTMEARHGHLRLARHLGRRAAGWPDTQRASVP